MMPRSKKGFILRLLFYAVFAFLIYLAVWLYSLNKVELKHVNIDQLSNIDSQGFTLSGYVEVYNGGIVPIRIDKITYRTALEDNDLELGQGVIKGEKIRPKETARFNVSQNIGWVPTADTAYTLATQNSTNVIVTGTVHLSNIALNMEIPFQEKVDIKPYVRQFIITQIGDKASDLAQIISNVVGKISEMISNNS